LATRNNKRALKVLRTLRERRKKQAQQIDILCNDIVSAHQDFSLKLSRLDFAVTYYEQLLSARDREEVLETTVRFISTHIDETSAAVFLLDEHGFDVHLAECSFGEPVESQQFRDWFTRTLVDHVSRTNRICSLEELLRMGLQGPPAILKTLSAAAVPLGRFGYGLGFIFVYRGAHRPLTGEELSQLAGVSSGLRDALLSFMPVTETAKALRR